MTAAGAVRYDLDGAGRDAVAADWLARHPTPAGRLVAVVTGAYGPLADTARGVERAVFEQRFGNDAAEMAAEYAAYEPHSRFVLVLDRDRGAAAGALRLLDGRTKALDDAPALLGRPAAALRAAHGIADGDPVREVATLAVLPAYRADRAGAAAVSALLYRAVLLLGRADGVRHLVLMLDRAAARILLGIGFPLQPLAGSAPFAYLGSAHNQAYYADVDTFEQALLRRAADPATRAPVADTARRIATGDGLDPYVVTRPGG